MSTKKRFSIAPDLAKGIRNTIQSASVNQGQLHYDIMSLDAIQPDPFNPRRLHLSHIEIINGVKQDDPNFQIKHKEREALCELAESIKRIGIKNAIEVYKEGPKYRIVTGERRFWAAIMAGHKHVPVHISPKPNELNLRYTQWVENINREDLSLWDKYNNLLLIDIGYKESKRVELDAQTLQELLGVSTTQAYRYFSLLKADDNIAQLIESGKLNNLKLIQELVSMKDKGARNQIVSWIQSSKGEVTSLANYREVSGRKVRRSKTGKRQSINLGKINNSHIAKQLIDIVLSDTRLDKYRHGFNNIDWTSPVAITKAFKDLYKTIEKEFSLAEIA